MKHVVSKLQGMVAYVVNMLCTESNRFFAWEVYRTVSNLLQMCSPFLYGWIFERMCLEILILIAHMNEYRAFSPGNSLGC